MELAKKLQFPSDTAIFLVNVPIGLELDIEIAKKQSPGVAVLLFANDSKTLEANAGAAIEAAKADGFRG